MSVWFYILWAYAGLCLYISHRHDMHEWGWIGKLFWLAVMLTIWPVYPICAYFKLV